MFSCIVKLKVDLCYLNYEHAIFFYYFTLTSQQIYCPAKLFFFGLQTMKTFYPFFDSSNHPRFQFSLFQNFPNLQKKKI